MITRKSKLFIKSNGVKKYLLIFCLILLMAPMFASAAPCVKAPGETLKPDALPKCINQIYVWSLGLGSLLALLMLILGGYTYMTAAGNAEQSGKGVEMIWSSVIGLALLFGAYLLLSTINPDLVKFNIDSLKGLDPK
jgi:hypothetical protein